MSLQAPAAAPVSGAPFRIGIVASCYNERHVGALLSQVAAGLAAAGVKESRIATVRVPGSNEIPIAVKLLAARRRLDAVVALGVIVRGDTIHYGLIAEAVAHALQRVSLDAGMPVINGVVVAENEAQADDRCLGRINRGAEFARAALAMAAVRRELS